MVTKLKSRGMAVLLAVCLGLAGCARGPKDVALIESGKQFLAKKDYSRAVLQFRSAIQANPKNFDAHYQMALAEIGRGDQILAYRALSRALELNPKNADAQLKMAELLLSSPNLDDIKEAQRNARLVLEASPDNPDALDAMAVAEMRLGNPDQALELLEQASSLAPRHLQTAVDLALVKLGVKDKAGAERALRQAVDKTPDSLPARVVLGAFYLMIGKVQAGEQELRTVLQKDPNNPLALLDLATVLKTSGRSPEAEQMYRRLAYAPPSQFQSAYGTYLLSIGKPKEAVSEFERLAKLDPKNSSARTRLVAAYVATNRVAEAQKLLEDTLHKNPKDTNALLQRSELRLMAGANEDARKDLEQVLHFNPESANAHFLLSKVERAEASTLKQRQELTETLRLDRRFFDARIALAQLFIMAGNGQTALDLMMGAPDDQKNSLGFIEYRNWALLASGDLKEFQKGISEGLAKGRTRGLVMQDALLKLRQGNDTAGRSLLLEILKSNPEDLGALDTLIRNYAAKRQLAVAIEKVRGLAVERPKSPALQYRLGVLLASSSQTKDARAALNKATEISPDFSAARVLLARLDRADGKPDDARRELEPLLSSKSGEPWGHMELSLIEVKSGNYTKAIEHLHKVVEAQPANVIALNNLAYLLADHTTQRDEALKYAQKAKELAPNDITVEGTLGWAYFQKGMYDVALQHLKAAVGREGKNVIDGTAIRRYHLAMAYAKIGNTQDASQTLIAARKLDPNLPEAPVATQMIGAK